MGKAREKERERERAREREREREKERIGFVADVLLPRKPRPLVPTQLDYCPVQTISR